MKKNEIEFKLNDLKNQKKKICKEIDQLDTEIIGLKILLEKILSEESSREKK